MTKLIILLLFLTACGDHSKISKKSSSQSTYSVIEETVLDISMSRNFDFLPLKGEVEKNGRFWSGDSWRLSRGAINYRWNAPEKMGFHYHSPTYREAVTLPQKLIRELAPSEKYDLWKGRYDYPLKMEVDALALTYTAEWEGLCHGWAPASMYHPEPKPRTMTNPDGVVVEFGSSDLKALLTYAYSKLLIRPQDSAGRRCEEQGFVDDNCNDDLPPDLFHIALANKIALRGQSIIADIDRYQEVWNHPLISYEAKIEKMVSKKKGRHAVITNRISYVDVLETSTWETHVPVIGHMTVKYSIELDEKGNIVSGEWLSRERPDFIWTIQRPEKFDDYLNGIFELLE